MTPEASGAPGPEVRGGALDSSALLERLPGVSLLALEVVDTRARTPSMQRLQLTGPSLATFSHQAGQDVMVAVPAGDGTTFRRRYTIAGLVPDPPLLTLDVVLHGDGPGARWAAAARPGDRVEALGPRGKVTLDPGATHHLFVGDESALPAWAAMVGALGPGASATVVAEVGGPEDQVDLPAGDGAAVTVQWCHRGPAAPGTSGLLAAAAAAVDLGGPAVHAYVAGELREVAEVRRVLAGRGLAPSQLSPKAYWRRGVANAAHGEPDRD